MTPICTPFIFELGLESEKIELAKVLLDAKAIPAAASILVPRNRRRETS
jgi:hypothetical protein